MKPGDYCLATKYRDGDPQDHWVVGFFKETWYDRYVIVDRNGAPFRANGFRRARKINADVGGYFLSNLKIIEQSGRSIWSHLRRYELQGGRESPLAQLPEKRE